MESVQIYNLYEKLPDVYKKEANNFIEFLFSKSTLKKNINSNSRGGLGISKGLYNMNVDFDEPLESFKEYLK